ncbi:hypothetical protein EVAR_74729_1 [Eumeta japonica]|uniref:Uncharacterized protein n=1 Tax=Eumeta variegata TaxID=151549 RepID=A0A4C1SP46_EUMVA|nr:hypothetical protein EVAR_74729_1 [Eumeta japonica]
MPYETRSLCSSLFGINSLIDSPEIRIRVLCIQRTELRCSELPANDPLRRFNAPQPSPTLSTCFLARIPIIRHCDAFVTNFMSGTIPSDYTISKRGGSHMN